MSSIRSCFYLWYTNVTIICIIVCFQAQKDEKELLYNTIIDVNRKQYAKLLTLERKEMLNQKEISDTWIKFVYLLIESTLQNCEENQKLFHNLDEYAQTLLLREQANLLRSQCNLPSYEVTQISVFFFLKMLAVLWSIASQCVTKRLRRCMRVTANKISEEYWSLRPAALFRVTPLVALFTVD